MNNNDNKELDLNIKSEIADEIYSRFLRGLNFVCIGNEKLIEKKRKDNSYND